MSSGHNSVSSAELCLAFFEPPNIANLANSPTHEKTLLPHDRIDYFIDRSVDDLDSANRSRELTTTSD
jgi:hypothetical protein